MKSKSRRQFLQSSVGVGAIGASALTRPRSALSQGTVPKPKTTSTEWRNDEANIDVIREVNRAYTRVPFTREFDGVLDDRPFELDWTTGPNLPVACKGGVSGIFGDEIALVGGLWLPGDKNLAYSYNTKTGKYSAIPPPSFPRAARTRGESNTEYTQGVGDGKYLYLISGRAGGRNVARLERTPDGRWQWSSLPLLPESNAAGRWLAGVGVVPGKWLFLVAGYPGHKLHDLTKSDEDPPLPNWRLRFDDPNAQWEPMAPYPPAKKLLWFPQCAVVRGKLYAFGGTEKDAPMWDAMLKINERYKLDRIVPYVGQPYYRDSYVYDPETDRWTPIRKVPVAWGGSDCMALHDRYILLPGMGDNFHYMSLRVGKSQPPSPSPNFWRGYNDLILAYDVEKDNYFRLGVMLYGVATCPWVTDGQKIYAFGGEPCHFWKGYNTENVAQIATIRFLQS